MTLSANYQNLKGIKCDLKKNQKNKTRFSA